MDFQNSARCNVITMEGLFVVVNRDYGIRPDFTSYEFGRIFSSMFGIQPSVCVLIWNELVTEEHVGSDHKFVYLLWAMNFLKLYNTVYVLACKVGVSTNTYMKWVWKSIESLCKLEVVRVINILLFIYMFIYMYSFFCCFIRKFTDQL